MTVEAPVARLHGVGRRFGSQTALRDVSLTIHAGEQVALLGPSGSGKSTLLALLNGSLEATSGTVEIFGREIGALGKTQRRLLQLRIGSVSQRLDLVEQVRVLHNVNAGRLGRWGAARAIAALVWPRPDDVARDALARVGLEWAVHERTSKLSGGEQQRVAIARVLVQQADLVLADEPVSSLDPSRAVGILALLRTAGSSRTLVVSLHQPELARRHCSRAIGLRDGEVVFDQPADQLGDHLLADLYRLP